MLYCRGDDQSMTHMMSIFKMFSDSTGLQANPKKCKEYFGGTTDIEKRAILTTRGFEEGLLPFKYLGVPLSSRKLNINQCQPLIDKIVARINHWTANLLSFAGRSQLTLEMMEVSVSLLWWNRAKLLCSSCCGMCKKKDKLWVKWLDAYYIKGRDTMQWNPLQIALGSLSKL